MVYFSRDYSLEHDVQSEARNYRAGSEIHQNIVRYDLVVPDTLDEICLDSLYAKKELSDRVLIGGLKSETSDDV
jgi:hypothetical protein